MASQSAQKSPKNLVSITQLKLACRHFHEMIEAGMTENFAIRTLELLANTYAKQRIVGIHAPDHVSHYDLWSAKAISAQRKNPGFPPGLYLRVEHGTPRRQFARYVIEAASRQILTEKWMNALCTRKWRVAVITHEEDKKLSKLKNVIYPSPEKRWAAAGIKFPRRRI